MTTTLHLRHSSWIIVFAFLAACGQQLANPIPTSIPSVTPAHLQTKAPLLTPLPTFTALPFLGPLPTVDLSASPVVPTLSMNKQVVDTWWTQIAIKTPIRTPIPQINLEELPKASIRDGNLYFQSRTQRSVQLTNSGKDREPTISDDAQKIAFYRGEASDNLHVINSDGTQEQVILTRETSLLIGKGEIVSPTFVPGTHILLFNTYLCGPRKGLYDGADCTAGVYSLNTDSGDLEKVVDNLSGSAWRDRDFEISPNGQYVSVAGSGHVDIYALSLGRFKLVYSNAIIYYVTTPDEYLPKQYWFPNSSGLITILAADGEQDDPADPPFLYTALRYTIKDNRVFEIPLDKFIVWGDGWSISPDRNWILFTGNEYGSRWDSRNLSYIGNLTNGHTFAYEETGSPIYYCEWSPDSKHFVLRGQTPGLIGSVDGGPVILVNGSFTRWIDATHYYYQVSGENADMTKMYIGEITNN